MCSINGVYSLNGILSDSDIHASRKIQKDLSYRGPDESGEFIDDKVSLNSNRFSITGVNNGSMPVSNEDGTVQVILNGEIYNYRELKKELEQDGHTFTTDSDTEVIAHAYEKYGEKVFEKLKGMFGIAIYDNGKLILAKDRFGEKPLFYLKKEGNLYFASESDPLVKLTDKQISADSLAEYFSLGFTINHLIDGIKRLPAGKYLIAKNGKTEVKTYWNHVFSPDYSISLDQAVDEYSEIFIHTLEKMLAHEVKSSIQASGGIDSATVAMGLLRFYDNLNLVSSGCVGMSGKIDLAGQDSDFAEVEKDGNEFRFTDAFVKEIGNINYHKKEFTVEDFIEKYEQFLRHLPGGPIINTSFPIWYFAAQEAERNGIRVGFSGEGADELLCGYKSNRPELYQDCNNLVERYAQLMGWMNRDGLSRLITGYFSDPFESAQRIVVDGFKGEGRPEDILMNKLRYMVGYGLVMAPHMLERADGMTMAHPLEIRLPFIHPDSAEYLYNLPANCIVQGGNTKIVLREVSKRLGVPEGIIIRPKQRTSLPYLKMFYSSRYAMGFQRRLLNKDAFVKNYLDPNEVDRLIIESSENPRRMLSLLNLETKLQQWFR